ncbi:MAG: SLC13 family permease [Planctomycetota bacterium]|nr:MAG: SLC13 family permease [Planctomycetota bacterium]
MGWEAWYTLGIVAALVAALASGKMGSDTCMLTALTLLMAAGVIDASEAVAGFAHPAVLMIAALFVVATGLSETGAMTALSKHLLGRPKTLPGALLRLTIPVTALSAFMNNTPIVAMYLPIVDDWSKKLNISPSKLFMPLSFAAILGGACTLIGTSTNLAVNSLYIEYFRNHAAELTAQFGLSEPSPTKQFWWISVVGVPGAIVGIGLIALLSGKLLPERRRLNQSGLEGRRYTVEMMVEPGSPLVGQSIEQAGLRHLPGLFLSEIERDGVVRPAVGPDEVLQANDRLVFVGVVESVVDLMKIRGLSPATDQVRKVEGSRAQRTLVEAVVSHNSPLVRRTVRQSQFRTRYNAAIVAVHRGGQRVAGKIGDIVLQPGDTLLLSTHQGFLEANRNSDHFYLVSGIEGAREVRHERAWVAALIMVMLVVLLTVPTQPLLGRQIPPITAGFLAATAMIITRCCTGTVARQNINWQVLLVIGAAIGIGRAMEVTGAAQVVADLIFKVVGPLGLHGALAGLFVTTTAFCQLITNKGAAVLMFPITMAVARDMNASPEPFVVTLMVASALSFLTPVGFVTNLMVFGPGGYRFTDYARLGTPLTIAMCVLCVLITPLAFPFHPEAASQDQAPPVAGRSSEHAGALSSWRVEPAAPMVRSSAERMELGGTFPGP